MIGEEKVAAETATHNKAGTQRRLIDFHSVSTSIKSFAVHAAIRSLDCAIWFIDVLIAVRERLLSRELC
ncbi:MAG: hypothetical protein GWP10_19515 [Nitrospiraceae bacterium]|nr:hypothetical protein [Nitrospiraceae bacterium]